MAPDEPKDTNDPETPVPPIEVVEPSESGESAPTEPVVPAIEAAGLGHEFRGVRTGLRRRQPPLTRALEGLSFTIGPGEAVGLVGAPGAGKTTLVELLTGTIPPTQGTLQICGLAPASAQAGVNGKVALVSRRRPRLWPDLPLADALRMVAAAHDLPHHQWIARRTELVQRLELASVLDHPIHRLSPGRRICSELAAALLAEPELVILDHPTREIDALSRERLRSFLRQEHRVHGRTILITSRDLSDVAPVCDRLLVLDQGRLAYDGDQAGLVERAGALRVLVVDLYEPARRLDDVPGTQLFAVEGDGRRQRLSLAPGGRSTAQVLADIATRATIRDLTLEEVPLEDLVRRLSPPPRTLP